MKFSFTRGEASGRSHCRGCPSEHKIEAGMDAYRFKGHHAGGSVDMYLCETAALKLYAEIGRALEVFDES